MGLKKFNIGHIKQIENIAVRTLVGLLWSTKGKEGIMLIQRFLNNNSKVIPLTVDGWLGNKSIKALSKYTSQVGVNSLIQYIDDWVTVNAQEPSYITIAKQEIGVKEIKGRKHNLRVLKYHSTSMGKYKNDEVAWCGSFVNWVMKEAGYKTTVEIPERAKSWKKFGTKVKTPSLGTIAIKSRKKGGHVCFVVGKSADNKYLYCLGGNQNDAVTIGRYRKNLFTTFVSPDGKSVDLPVYENGREITREA